MRVYASIIVTLFTATTLLADAKITQKTQMQFGGVLGAAANVFGGRAAKEGITSDIVVKNNRRLSRMGDVAEIVDLDEEKIYNVDYAKKTYKVTTFAELRKQFEEAMKNQSSQPDSNQTKKPEGPEYEVVFDSKATGERLEINGYNAKQVIATVTVKEKGKKLEQSGGMILTADLWMAPRIAAVREHEEFERRYITKLWGTLGVDLRSMAALTALAPEMSKAMKKFGESMAGMDGSAVRTELTFETVPDPRQRAERDGGDEEAASPASQATKALGGLMSRIKKKPAEDDAPAKTKTATAKTKGASMLFTSRSELLRASATASAADVALPAGFKVRK